MSDIVFQDGDQIRRLKGRILESEDKDFIIVETDTRIVKVNKQFIIKIEEDRI